MGRRKNILDDKSFFLQFYEENKGFLFYTAQKYTSDATVQEDIVQDTVLRLLKHIDTLRTLDRNRALKYVALTVRSSFLDQERKHTPVDQIGTIALGCIFIGNVRPAT